jgi:hypothetical protein
VPSPRKPTSEAWFVDRPDRRVGRRLETRVVADRIPRSFVLGILSVDEVGVLDGVIVNQRDRQKLSDAVEKTLCQLCQFPN